VDFSSVLTDEFLAVGICMILDNSFRLLMLTGKISESD